MTSSSHCVHQVVKMATSRSERFVDTTFHKAKRPYYEANPFATKPVPANFEEIKALLINECKNNEVYDKIWKYGERRLAWTKKNKPHLFVQTTPDECYTAVIAYTSAEDVGGKLLHREFNAAFRALTDETSWQRFQYKSFYYLLTKAMPGIKNNPTIGTKIYRGISVKFTSPKPEVGKDFYFDAFASTSADEKRAKEHIINNGGIGTLVVLQDGAEVAMGIADYSFYSSEEEVLVLPRSKFKVQSFTEKPGGIDVLVLKKNGSLKI